MSLRQKYLEIVSKLVTPGAIGMAVLLGSTAPGAASQEPADQQPAAQGARVSERLAAIRDAVSAVSGVATQPSEVPGQTRLAWVNWGNGGFGFGFGVPWGNWNNWHNWPNWRNFWRNW